jgi:hypothetical protein
VMSASSGETMMTRISQTRSPVALRGRNARGRRELRVCSEVRARWHRALG